MVHVAVVVLDVVVVADVIVTVVVEVVNVVDDAVVLVVVVVNVTVVVDVVDVVDVLVVAVVEHVPSSFGRVGTQHGAHESLQLQFVPAALKVPANNLVIKSPV